jgi:DNA-binding NarL/FixJ family response regulator
MKPNPTKILLVDDHLLMLKGLRLQLEQDPSLAVLGSASSGSQALEFAAGTRIDVAVVDLHLPDMGGIQLVRSLLQINPEIKVVILSSDSGMSSVREALLAGAVGYVLKENTDQELLAAIHDVSAGKTYLCPQLNSAVVEDYKQALNREAAAPTIELSEREREVLRMIAEGLRNKEMAARLDISVKSVETYRRRLMQKLRITSAAGLTHYAIREGLVDL